MLTQFDMEKDEWYYQPDIYINRQDADPTYNELKDFRLEFLKQLAFLYREKLSNCLSYWKDSVFEKKDWRNLLLEYKSLSWTNDLAFEKRTGGKKKA
jgi:hypothetical protein